MKKLVTFLILIAVASGGAYYYYVYGKTQEKPQVIQAAISRGTITEAVSATGTLEALRTVQVGSQVSGVVKKLYVDFNSIVTKDQIIAELDPSLLQVQVEIQKANVARQEGDIENQQVQLENDQRNLERTKELFAKLLVNQQQLEAAELQVKTRQASILSSQRQLIQTRANLQQAELNVSYTTIRSPIDGVVIARQVDTGQTVQASMNTPQFFTIATDLRSLKLTGSVDEAEIGKIRPGMDVTFGVDSYPNQEFHGKVNAVRLNAQTQSNVVTYPVWIDVPNPDLKLRPSMTANLKIIVATAQDVLRVPNQAMRFRPNADIYAALGLQAPAPGQGRSGGQGGRTGAAGTGTGTSTQPSAPQGQGSRAQGDATQGQRAQSAAPQSGRSGGGGFGSQSLTPEQRAEFSRQFGGGRGGQRPTSNLTAPQTPLTADKIDELFSPVPRTQSRNAVWTWNEEKKELKQINIMTGITDGQFTEVLSTTLQVGQQVITGIVLPAKSTTTTSTGQSNPFAPQQNRGGGFGGGRGGGRGGN
jgi:HlyD family secretion protein